VSSALLVHSSQDLADSSVPLRQAQEEKEVS
jgi:hypothetical protein